MAQPPNAFLKLCKFVKARVDPQSQSDPIVQLVKPTPPQLAEITEDSHEFTEFASTEIRGNFLESKKILATFLLKDSGFYHGVLNGESEAVIWSRVSEIRKLPIYPKEVRAEEHTEPQEQAISTLLILDGFRFCRDEFKLLDCDIVKLSKSSVLDLGKRAEIKESFYPDEAIDAEWLSQFWWLRYTRVEAAEYDLALQYIREDKEDIVLDKFWRPLLLLGIYDEPCFQIPVILEVQPGCHTTKLRNNLTGHDINIILHSYTDEEGKEYEEEKEWVRAPRRDYMVGESASDQFQSFLRFCKTAAPLQDDWEVFRKASRRYLRATFLCGPNGDARSEDDEEDVLLLYIFALETLLLSGDREALTDKIAIRAALLAGSSNEEREFIFGQVKDFYDARSRIVHGGSKKKKTVKLRDVRDVLRRILAITLAVGKKLESEDKFKKVLKDLPINHRYQRLVQQARKAVLSMVRDQSWQNRKIDKKKAAIDALLEGDDSAFDDLED